MDYVKHVTTLNTGSIVVVVSLLSSLDEKRHAGIVAASLALFIGATVLLTLCILGVLNSMRTPTLVDQGTRTFTTLTFFGGLAGFGIGVSLLAVFSIVNLL